jgi:hypothetical protein
MAARRRKRGKTRFVYVVARPLQSAGLLSLFSDGKFALCHWGVLLSRFDGLELGQLTNSSNGSSRVPCGTFIELVRCPTSTFSCIQDFDLVEFDREWAYVSAVSVGKSRISDKRLEEEGASQS